MNSHGNKVKQLISQHAEHSSWSADNLAQLNTFLSNHTNETAVFDADGTLWADDVGEAFFRWLIAECKLLNIEETQHLYHQYEQVLAQDARAAYQWIVTIMAGISESELKKWSHQFFDEYFVSRIYACQKELVSDLHKHNFDVWIVSASNEWIVKAGAKYFNIDESRVLGVRLAVCDDILTNQILAPFTYQYGKVEAIKSLIGKQPALIVGDSMADLPMLQFSSNMRLYITHDHTLSDPAVNAAKSMGCLIQYFPLLTALQFKQEDWGEASSL